MSNTKIAATLFLCTGFSIMSSVALGDEDIDKKPSRKTSELSLGLGVMNRAKFSGSSENEIRLIPAIRYTKDRFKIGGEGGFISYQLTDQDAFSRVTYPLH